MKGSLLILILFFSINLGLSQNGDINLLKKINHSYTPSGGNFMTFITNTDDPVTFGIPGAILIKGLISKEKEDFWKASSSQISL